MQEKNFTPLQSLSMNPKKNNLILTIIIIIAIAGFVLYQNQTQKNNLINSPKSATSQREIESLIRKVGELIILPDEEPAIATVIAEDKLKDKPFFADVKNGDKVLFFSKSRKAVLYRPSVNKVVNVAVISQEVLHQASQSATAADGEKIRLAIYFDNEASQEADLVEKQIAEKLPQFEVVEKSSSTDNYASSFVIDLEGDNQELAAHLAAELKAQVASFPSQEQRPNAQILLILAK